MHAAVACTMAGAHLTRDEMEAIQCGESDRVGFCLSSVHDDLTASLGLNNAGKTPCHQMYAELERMSRFGCRVSHAYSAPGVDTDTLRSKLKMLGGGAGGDGPKEGSGADKYVTALSGAKRRAGDK